MKIKLSLLLILLSAMTVKAQMVRWIMYPVYDKIHVSAGAPVIVSDSLNFTSLWNLEGKRMATTNDFLNFFREGIALTTQRGSDVITGFYKPDGKFTPVENYSVLYSHPFFSDGFLLAVQDSRPYFINTEGQRADFGYFEKAYPFNRELAVLMTYESVEKQKNPYYFYVNTKNEPVEFKLNNKPVDKEDVVYLSSMGDFGMGIAIIKGKFYYYEKSTGTLKAILNDDDKQKQLQLSGDLFECLEESGDSIIVNTRPGKKDNVKFVFDKLNKPEKIYFAKSVKSFQDKEIEANHYNSELSVEKAASGTQVGLKYRDKVILSPQFDAVNTCINDYAIVQRGNKQGLLFYDKSLSYSLKMNKGNDIAFRHQKFETTVRLDLPTLISSHSCRFEISPKSGCVIDKTSIVTRDTESGNFVQYNCVLNIPETLPDVLTTIEYPVQITYDGLKCQMYNFPVKAWHYKYINVDLNESETKVSKGDVNFTINLSAERLQGDTDYPFEVQIKAGSLRSKLEKLSETRYKCYLYALQEGVNEVNIHIMEEGCPPSKFPFNITYTKPVDNRSVEQVSILKRPEISVVTEADGQTVPQTAVDGQQTTVPAATPQTTAPATTAPATTTTPATTTAPAATSATPQGTTPATQQVDEATKFLIQKCI